MQKLLPLCLLLTTGLTGIQAADNPKEKNDMSYSYEVTDKKSILEDTWQGPYGGVPPFDKIRVADFQASLDNAMSLQLAEIDKITSNNESANFSNTIVALEKAGRTLERVQTIFDIWSNNMSTDQFQVIEREMAPKLAAFSDKITQNTKLFERIEKVYNSPEKKSLTPEEQRLCWNYYTNFVRAGAKLDAKAKARMSELNQELAKLYTDFSQNLLADESDRFIKLTSKDLTGLPPSLVDAYAEAAKNRDLKDTWVVNNTRSSVDPFLTYSDNREMRKSVWNMFVNRGDNGDKNDNNKIIKQILILRQERARLLGYKSHAHWRLENSMAKTPENAMALMEKVWPAAIATEKEEVGSMLAISDQLRSNITIEPWDYRYFAEKVRKQRYDLDQTELKEYLQLDKLREGMFWVAGELFNFTFVPISNVPVYHPDIKVWEVKDKTTGKHIGLWYFDAYAREGKRSGAWMNAYRNQQKLENVTTIVSNNSNFVKGKPGEPVLISWDDANTLFHEFGHALHGLSSNVNYPSLSGTNVYRDYVEFPSQLLEHWLSTPEVLQRFAVHYKTGKPIPQTLVEKIKKASTFNEGFATTEYLASALIDMKLHLADATTIDPDAFEKKTLADLGMPSEIVMRHRTPQFGHIFSGDGYSAGYYSYMWADVITADCFEAFEEAGGPYDQTVAKKLRDNIFNVGNTIDPADGYRNFRGRDANPDALMRSRGFLKK